LLETVFERNADSQYAGMSAGPLFQLYQATGQKEKALAFAEKMLQKDQSNEDMLLVAASHYYDGMKDKLKVVTYTSKVLEILPAKPAPQGVAEADWQAAKTKKLGLANWMLGVVYSTDQKWAQADKSLRAALPAIKDNRDLLAETYFHLGVANFRMGDSAGDKQRILDALQFNQQCAAIPGRYQALAKKNIAAIRSQYHIQ
jgi:tetratricopeptide (TPR) repeat protein